MNARILAGLIVTIVLVAHGDDWPQWFDESCQIAGYLNVEEARQVPLIADLIDGQDHVSRIIGSVREWTSIDLDSVTDAWFGVAGKDNAIFVLKGDFNLSVIRGRLTAIEQFEISTPPDVEFAATMPDDKRPGNYNMAAFLTPSILAFGQPARVEAFLLNRLEQTPHPRHAELATLEAPVHLFEAVLLEVPNEKGDVPAVILNNIDLVHITAEAGEQADLSLALQPKQEDMVPGMQKLAQGLVDLYGALPRDQVRLNPIQKALLDRAAISATSRRAVLKTSLPLELLREPLAAKIRPADGTRQ